MKKNYLSKMENYWLKSNWLIFKNCKNSTTTWLVALFVLFGVFDVFGQVVEFTTPGNGTWTCPAGVTQIRVEVIGAGGGVATPANNNSLAGGGGGAYAQRTTFNVTPTVSYNFTVGVGGSGNGGDTFFGNTTAGLPAGATAIAQGGRGSTTGTGAAGGSIAASTGDIRFAGGNGDNNTSVTSGGGGGGAAGATGNGNPGVGNTGGAPGTGYIFTTPNTGFGGNSRNTAGNGLPGINYGGGAGSSVRAGGTGNSSTNGANGAIRITYIFSPPTITSFAPTSGCIGSTVTITGTNFSGATAVNFNGIASTFTVNSATQITATVPVGATTGLISVTTPGGSGNSAGNFTILSAPSITTQPVATSICTSGSGTFTVAATGATTFQWRRNGTPLANGGIYSGVTTATLTITNPTAGDAGNFDVIVGNGSCTTTSSVAALTVNTVPGIASTPTPANAATGICYSGSGILSNITWGVVAGATSYDVYFGPGATPPVTLTANVATNSYSVGTLLPSTTYSWRIVARNACGAGTTSANFTFTTAASPCSLPYCTPSIGAPYATSTNHHIRKVEFIGTLQDIVNTSSFPTVAPFGYTDFTGLAVKSIQAKGEGVNIYMESPNSGYIKAWVDWNSDGDFADAGETVYNAGGTSQASTTLGFIVPTGIAIGDYRVRLRISGRNGVGADAGSSWNSCTTNLAYYGETEDYILRVIENCAARISSITNGSVCESGVVTLNVTGTIGTTEFRWYSSQTGGAPIATTATGTWTTPSISTTTVYWVTAFNGSCETLVRTKITAQVRPVPTLSFATSNTEVCGENSVVALTASGDNEVIHLINETFEGGLGTFSNVHYVSNPAIDATTAWQIRTSPFVPTGLTWFPAIQSNFGANNFAFVNSDIGTRPCGGPPGTVCYYTVDNGLVSNTVNSTGFLSLTFTFRAYFDRYYPNGTNPANELMTVDVSTNGGTTWISLSGNITSDIGYGTKFTDYSYNLNAYINQANLKVRIRYYTDTWANGAAIDDIELFGTKPLSTALNWSGTPMPDVYTDAATTIPYVSGTPATIVYVKPALGQLETGSYTFTATATLTNGCAVSQDITIENKSSIWKGTVDNNWNNPNNWSPAIVPTANSCVIIPNTVNTSNIVGTNYNGFGKSLIIKNGGRLDVQSNNTLTITDGVTVEATGTFNLENAASLIQVNNVANSGIISMKRNVNVRKLDYVYWSSPVASFPLSSISTTVNRYKWLPTVGANLNGWGTWEVANENMVNGKGYIVRGPDSYTSTPQNYTQNFVGVPNNGNITMPISRGTYDGVNYVTGVSGTLATRNDDNWNLIGNPYPSAISANTFLAANTNIAGFIKFWTHSTLPSAVTSDPFYNNYGQNYTVSDYVNYNATGANPPIGNGNIAAGQGFFVLMNHSSAGVNENVLFNNSMRRNDYRNDLFYRNGNITNTETEEKHRVWLNLISPSLKSSPVLIGYTANATNDIDRMYDVPALDVKTNFELYSFSTTNKLNIQGKALPFSNDDRISLGVSIEQAGSHSIDILKVDGLFESASQNIYLEDLTLGITHDLRTSPYFFTSAVGRFENRFVLKFSNQTLGNEDFNANAVTVYTNESINVIATNQTIKSVKIHDLLGRVVGVFNTVNSNEFKTSTIAKTQSALLVEVTLENGAKQTYKVIF